MFYKNIFVKIYFKEYISFKTYLLNSFRKYVFEKHIR